MRRPAATPRPARARPAGARLAEARLAEAPPATAPRATATGSLPTLLAVLLGGACGTGLRMLVDLLLPHSVSEFPLGTLIVNVAGAFALGLLVARLWANAPEWLKAGLGAGLLGSFTTYSAVMVSFVAGATSGFLALAVAYLALSLVLGLAAAALGLRVGRVSAPIDWADE